MRQPDGVDAALELRRQLFVGDADGDFIGGVFCFQMGNEMCHTGGLVGW